MKKDAEMHAADDQKKRELAEARNMADTMIYTAEKGIRDAGDKISPEVRSDIETKIAALKSIKDNTDKDAIQRASQELSVSLQKIGEALYQKEGKSAAGEEEKDTAKEAEYEEKKDDTPQS